MAAPVYFLMQSLSQFWTTLHQLRRRHLHLSSLQFRLTVEIATLSALSLGGFAVWTSWKIQQILIETRTQNVEYIGARFPRDVQLYSEMLPIEVGLQKTIDNVTVPGLLIWVKSSNGKLLAHSAGLEPSLMKTAELMSLAEMPPKPQVYQVRDQYLILSASSVVVKRVSLGKVYMAQDVTDDQRQLRAAIHSLAIVCVLIIIALMGAITLRIRRSLQPLQEMNQMAGAISVEDLSEAKLQLRHAPSEVKELAQTFNMMLSRLSDSWEQQRQFVSNISHELRTPLTVVVGYLQSLLRRSTNLSDYQREALETAASEADRTVRLLQDLLDLARADSGYIPIHLEPLVLNDVVAEMANMADVFDDRHIMLEMTTEVTVLADRDRFKQVLINLIDNAIKYSDPAEPIVLRLEKTEKQAILHVCDRGIGIPLPDQNRIFERFYRVDDDRSRLTGGHGLGLAIVKTLIESMNGNITVQSKPGEGSTFTVTLPLRV